MEEETQLPVAEEERLQCCGLCKPFDPSLDSIDRFWHANAPSSNESTLWISFLGSNFHVSCLEQAKAEDRIVSTPIQIQSPIDASQFPSLPPLVRFPCTSFPKPVSDLLLPKDKTSELDILIQGQHQFRVGFRLFPQVHPPRKLVDLLQCTNAPPLKHRLSESSLPIEVQALFPDLFASLTSVIPPICCPGSESDALLGKCGFQATIAALGAAKSFRRSRFRTGLCLLQGKMEIGSLSPIDAERIHLLSRAFCANSDTWIPDVSFCLRHGAVLHHALVSNVQQQGEFLLLSPGSAYWLFFQGCKPGNVLVEWSFVERSVHGFEYVLSLPEEELLDTLDATFSFLLLPRSFLLELWKREHKSLLSQDLSSAIFNALFPPLLLLSSAPSPTPPPPLLSLKKSRCDSCRRELFHYYFCCMRCHNRQGAPVAVELEAFHSQSRLKKDRSLLPDFFRAGSRVLVNLTVSGNSNDRPVRLTGASYLSGILTKTGHGFFTVYLEGTGESVVRRRASLDPHPLGTSLPNGFLLRLVNPEDEDTHAKPTLLTSPFQASVFCAECMSLHCHQQDDDVVVVDNRNQVRLVALGSEQGEEEEGLFGDEEVFRMPTSPAAAADAIDCAMLMVPLSSTTLKGTLSAPTLVKPTTGTSLPVFKPRRSSSVTELNPSLPVVPMLRTEPSPAGQETVLSEEVFPLSKRSKEVAQVWAEAARMVPLRKHWAFFSQS